MLSIANAAAAQEASQQTAAEETGTIIVTGTRRAERTLSDSSVPVDVIGAKDLAGSTPSPDLSDKLARLVPSFNVQRLPTTDGASFVRPATLRGLSPDQTLVLIDSKRRHRSAYISLPLQGQQAVDLSQIPQIALKRVEVLRDGASAQYGSDAIAGVINLILDDSTGYSLNAQAGQYYKGDGTLYQIEGRASFALGDRGFFSLSGEYGHQGETDRGDGTSKVGQPLVKSWKLFFNSEYALTEGIRFYAFGNFNETRSSNEFNFRAPDPTGNLYRRSFFQDNPPFLFPTYSLTNIYPGGFIPIFAARSRDTSLIAGLKGQASDNFSWDLSGRYGRNRIRYRISDTINASLGPNSPTSFDAGANIQTEYAANADFNWLLEAGLYKPVSVSFGAEWRRERYEVKSGDEASYVIGPLSDLPGGSNGYVSPTPEQAGIFSRDSRAAYLDIDLDFTERFNIGAALRYENYDDFGSTWNYKFSSRYKATPWLSLRAAVSTGFHAPTVGQQNLTSTSQFPDPTSPPPAPQIILTNGLIPSNNPIALAVGGKPLVPEKATNYSAGIVLTPARGLTLSVDYYDIEIRKRLGISNAIQMTPGLRSQLLAQGISQAAQLSSFRFFINGYDTRTKGVDIVASYGSRLGAGQLTLTAAYNYNKSKVLNGDPRIVTPTLEQTIASALPRHTGNIGADYQIGRLGFGSRVRYYSGFIDSVPFLTPDFTQHFGPRAFVDISGSYAITPAVRLTAGIENLFDNYPGRYRSPLSDVGFKYPLNRPYEADGGRYYARLSAKF